MQRLIDADAVKENHKRWIGYLDDDMIGRMNFAIDHHVSTVLTIPDNPTNGQMQLVLYPELEVRDFGSFVEAHSPNVELRVSKSWWNTPFKSIDKNAYADKQGLEFADMPVLRSAT